MDELKKAGLKEKIKVLATGKITTAFDIVKLLCIGADATYAARSMLLALGCIQALRCNNNKCPTGVATQDPNLVKGLHVPTPVMLGVPADTTSHYARVREMRAAWDALSPAARAAALRPVPANPQSYPHGDVDPSAEVCLFTDRRAVALATLGTRAYELMLLLLTRQYGASDATAADLAMYQGIAFFPLMTMVVRPVGEMLVQLPAGDGRHAAAFTFELDGPIRAYRDRVSFHRQLVERFAHLAAGFAELAAAPDVPARMAFVAKNVAYLTERVRAYVAANP